MQRDFERLGHQRFDVLVIGGGVTGAMIAWDAVLRGLSVALVEKGDFCAATSAANSRLIHGGLRYLRQGHFGVVRDSLRERRYWLRTAPQLVSPLGFFLPMPTVGSKVLNRLGLYIYDRVGGGADLPPTRSLSPTEARALVPMCAHKSGAGALLYHDAQMVLPERLVLSVLQACAQRGACVANYVRAERVCTAHGRVAGVEVRDEVLGGQSFIRARWVVNATGPWADRLPVEGLEAPPRLMRSAGIHLVTPALTDTLALAVPHRGGHFFILPWRGYSLIGTTDQRFEGDPDEYCVSEAAIDDLLATVNDALPSAGLTRQDVRYCYGGLRPLVAGTEHRTYRASRRADVIDHERDGIFGLISAVGGKWTTARSFAARVVDRLTGRPSLSWSEPLPITPRSHAENPGLESKLQLHLYRLYGDLFRTVLEAGGDEPLPAPEPLVPAQAGYAARHEMALKLADVVFRRTGIGLLGVPGDACLGGLAAAMGEELGWSKERMETEIEEVQAHYGRTGVAA